MARSLEGQINHYNQYIRDILGLTPLYKFSDKAECVQLHSMYMLNRTHCMFKWENLPDTITERALELYLQTNGNVCFYKHEGSLYVFTGGLGGEPDVYYRPTIYTIANPALKLSKSLKIGKDCIVMPNDTLYIGLRPLFSRYATLLTENELSIKLAITNSRIIDIISAPDDRTKASAEKFLQDIEEGKSGIIAENAFLDGLRSQPYGNTGSTATLSNLIEMEQYIKASWFNELGLNANYNMKRERLNTIESQMNHDALLPLIDDMLKCRKEAIEKVNEMFGTNITVDFSSSWEDNEEEIELEHERLANEVANANSQITNDINDIPESKGDDDKDEEKT